MSYTALARRYRSQSFDELVGQEPIAQTLMNAIKADRIHHAYLFCGTRGVGKTSMARIFARALNAPDTIKGCPKPKNADYPPKDVQERMAEAIMRGEDMNVIEIDGASNRGVDDARQLIANAGLAPTANAKYKVYIIDEVHMLTREAFNALLKTMEEPPSHLKFILATTEAHKVLPTILSRCQRFDFQNISTSKIVEHLGNVLKAEKVKADPAVLFQVARLGNGSMRDALSLLDRLLATGESPITAEVLEKMLGLPDRQLILDLTQSFADSNAADALTKTDALLNRGISQDQLLTILIEHLRNLMLLASCGEDSPLVELDEESKKQAAEQAGRFDAAALVHMMALLENVARYSKTSSTPRALLDAAVVRLALSEKFADLAALAQSSDQKKKVIQTNTPSINIPQQAIPPRPAARSAISPPASRSPQTSPQPPRPVSKPASRANPGFITDAEREAAARQPLVKEVTDLFGASIVGIANTTPRNETNPQAQPDQPTEEPNEES